jgi:membrane-bound metal-dependent hydrolase YbcI (DUF457 family)
MLIFAHTGITLGVAMVLKKTLASVQSREPGASVGQQNIKPGSSGHLAQHAPAHKARWSVLLEKVDMRVLLVGSLLPDIIDKPLGQLLLRETLSNGRIFCHTLLFFMIIALAGLYLYRNKGKDWGIVLSFGIFTHLILDEMWRAPKTLLWPIYGFAFSKADLTGWIHNILLALFTDPAVYVPELVGVVILIWFAALLIYRRRISTFFRNGQVP